MIGYMVNNFLPRVGEVVRPYTLGRLESISKTAAFGTVIIERIIDIITFFSILLAVLFFYSNSFAELFPSFASMEPLFLAGSIISLALFVLFFFKAEFFFSLFRRVLVFLPEKIRNKIEHLFDSFLSGFAISKYPGQFLMIIVTSYIIWGLYLLLMYLPFYAFDMMGSSALNFGSATVLMVVSTVAFAFPTPSGFGTYHSFTSFALTRLYHVDGVTALSYTILTHEVGVFITTVIGLYYFFKDHIRVTEMVNDAE
jgi:glycosyltransferase 2 family protein